MLHLKGYSVWVVIAGTSAQEYGVEVLEGQNEVKCWIPSEEGKTFEIRIKDNEYHTPTDAGVFVDGTSYGGKPINGTELREHCKRGFRTSPTTVRPFMFSRLIVTDDDSLMCSASPDIGEIKVIIRHTEISAPSHHHVSRWTASGTKRNAPTQITVHERTKKAVDHQTSLGQDIQSQARFIESKPYGPPLLTFRFRYRPIAMLQANGIVPRKRARSQEVELGPEDVIDISSDSDSGELDRLRERIRLLEGRQQERVPKKIKREPSVKRELIVGEVIDLTES